MPGFHCVSINNASSSLMLIYNPVMLAFLILRIQHLIKPKAVQETVFTTAGCQHQGSITVGTSALRSTSDILKLRSITTSCKIIPL